MASECFERAFRRYCHADVVSHFDGLEASPQRAFIDAFRCLCHDKYTDEAVEAMMARGMIGLEHFEHCHVDGNEDACPLELGLRHCIPRDKPIIKSAVESIRTGYLPDWGKARPRCVVEARQQEAIECTRRQSIAASLPGMKHTAHSNSSSLKPVLTAFCWDELEPISFRSLSLFEVARGRVAHCTIKMEPVTQVGVLVLAEDDHGDVMQIGLYNQLPGGRSGPDTHAMAESMFAIGTRISIAEPFLKVMKDGHRGVRVDSPQDLRIHISNPSMASLKEKGNMEVAQLRFDCARETYLASLHSPEVDHMVALLSNRAQAFMESSPAEACRDAAAALILRPEHQKSWMRYAAALENFSADFQGEEGRCAMLCLAGRARNAAPGGGDLSCRSISKDAARQALGSLLSNFAEDLVQIPEARKRWSAQVPGETHEEAKAEGNRQYKKGLKDQAMLSYTVAIQRVGCTSMVAAILSNLSQVFLALSQPHNAIAYASAASRLNVETLSKKLFFRVGRGLHQLGETDILNLLCQHEAGPHFNAEVTALQRLGNGVSYKTRLYHNTEHGEVFAQGAGFYPDDLPECARGVKVTEVEGKGRGAIATQDFLHCELVVVSRALGAAVVEDENLIAVTSGTGRSGASGARLKGMLANAAPYDNELSWILSQLSTGRGPPPPVVQLDELTGLSPRWLPLLAQCCEYYPPCDRVILATPVINSIVEINSHGHGGHLGGKSTGLFPRACFFNHSRDSNCTYVPVTCADGSRAATVLAVMTKRSVQEGEELTVSYCKDMKETNHWGIPACPHT